MKLNNVINIIYIFKKVKHYRIYLAFKALSPNIQQELIEHVKEYYTAIKQNIDDNAIINHIALMNIDNNLKPIMPLK
jgi:hypothetical protein